MEDSSPGACGNDLPCLVFQPTKSVSASTDEVVSSFALVKSPKEFDAVQGFSNSQSVTIIILFASERGCDPW